MTRKLTVTLTLAAVGAAAVFILMINQPLGDSTYPSDSPAVTVMPSTAIDHSGNEAVSEEPSAADTDNSESPVKPEGESTSERATFQQDYPIVVREEYHQSSDTPNHLVFGAQLIILGQKAESDYNRAVLEIQSGVNTETKEEAKQLLDQLLKSSESLIQDRKNLEKNMLCNQDLPQDRNSIYKRMDALDDARMIASRNQFDQFLYNLDDATEERVMSWLERKKQGFYFRTAEHKSMFDKSGYDVTSHVIQLCVDLADTE